MKTLKTTFSKNGLEYTLMKRTDKVALFLLGPVEYPDGYEVCRIYVMRPFQIRCCQPVRPYGRAGKYCDKQITLTVLAKVIYL